MKKLKQTAAENKAARLEREKRRRKVLYEQLKAQDAQEASAVMEIAIISFIHSVYFYSASSSPLLLRGTPYAARSATGSY